MFDDAEIPAQILENPGQMQSLILSELAERTNGNVVVADPNNPFMFSLEASSSISSQIVRRQETVFDAIYAKRSTTAEELYRFMSDFDYLDVMAEPAPTEVTLLLDRDEIARRAPVFNSNYKKVVLPASTVVRIGSRRFGIYYPIEIRINTRTGNFLVQYDTTSMNPLFTLSSNFVEHLSYTQNSQNLLKITIPVYQFERTVYDESVVIDSGFKVSYRYTNNFMAARVFTYLNNKWQELTYTLSEDVYDRSVATAKLKVLTDQKRVQISIPQVYLNKGMVGTQLRVELYTTLGAINTVITQDEARGTEIYDGQGDTADQYTLPLRALTLMAITPKEARVVGGKTGISFEELRNRVIYGSLVNSVPVTPLDIQNFVADQGFKLTKYRDNVTSRIYYANRKLVSGDDTTVPVTVANVALSSETIANTSSILSFTDNIITVLPTTVYKYSESSGQCTPLSDDEIATLSALSNVEWAEELNTKIYTRMPYHLVTYTSDKYPESKTFNLNTPGVNRIQFVRENVNSVAQMQILIADVLHNGNGTGGFTVRIGVQKTKELVDVPESKIHILFMTTDRSGRAVHLKAVKVSENEVHDVYHVNIPTTYHITSDGYIRTTMNISATETTLCDIPLVTEFDVRLMVDQDVLPDTAAEFSVNSVPDDYADAIGLIQQTLEVQLGEDLSEAIFNITDVVWSPEEYATWPTTEYLTYAHDVYEKDVNGELVYTIVPNPDYDDQDPESRPNLVQLNKLHSAGDFILDGASEPIIQHEEGDIKRDSEGQPIVLNQRTRVYYVESLMFDAKLYESSNEDDQAYLTSISAELSGYVTTVKSMKGQLLDLTELYLRPIRTIGSAQFGLGNGNTIRMSLGLGFTIKYYVSRAVMVSDNLKEVIISTTQRIIESHMGNAIISLTAISSELREALSENIDSIDAIGINGSSIQTLIVDEDDAAPMVARKLVVQPDGSSVLEADITVDFAISE